MGQVSRRVGEDGGGQTGVCEGIGGTNAIYGRDQRVGSQAVPVGELVGWEGRWDPHAGLKGWGEWAVFMGDTWGIGWAGITYGRD